MTSSYKELFKFGECVYEVLSYGKSMLYHEKVVCRDVSSGEVWIVPLDQFRKNYLRVNVPEDS